MRRTNIPGSEVHSKKPAIITEFACAVIGRSMFERTALAEGVVLSSNILQWREEP
jgi:hypothetical protein